MIPRSFVLPDFDCLRPAGLYRLPPRVRLFRSVSRVVPYSLHLVAADVRGIPSHGTARLARYVNGLETGIVRPDAAILHPGDSDHADDAGSGMDGQTWREFCRNDVSGAGQMFAQSSLKLACFLRRVDVDDAHAFNGTSP